MRFVALFIAGIACAHAQAATDGAEPALRGLDAAERLDGRYVVVLEDERVDSLLEEKRATDVELAVHSIAQDFAFRYGGTIEFTYGHALKGFAISGIDEGTAKAISADADVAFVETDKRYTISTVQSPATWGLDRIDQRALPLNNSYSYTSTGIGVHAYVVDSGIKAHNEFSTRLQPGYTAISDGNGTSDCNGHGTHVAGTIGGSTYGVAKAVSLYPVRVLDCAGASSSALIIAGLNWVSAHALTPAVVNMSLGGPVDTGIESAVTTVLSHNISVVVAAGNFFDDACLYTPARMGQTSNVIDVANSTITDARNTQSDWGRCVTLFAPGTDITSAGIASPTATAVMTGTSMSSPHVAGAAALYLQANMSATPAAVKTAIVFAATRGAITGTASSPNRLLYTGFGQSGGSDPAFTPAPGATTNLSATCVQNGGLYKFRWTGSGDVGDYEIYQGSTLSARAASSPVNLGLAGTTTTTWKVRACNGAGCGAFSNTITVNYSQICK